MQRISQTPPNNRKRPQVSVALPPETIATLEGIAEAEHTSVAQVIRALVCRGLSSETQIKMPMQTADESYQNRIKALEGEVIGLHTHIAELVVLVMQHESKLRKENHEEGQKGSQHHEGDHE